ncbi:MAG TPA: hypothetical protein VNU26_16975 [Mycobacteriales bacterium]|nr:hypothetical protein [Mycobacteriales bacterium]
MSGDATSRSSSGPEVDESPDGAAAAAPPKRPLYPRLLRLKNIAPNGWQRAALGEGALAVAVVLVLADVASAWTLLALPLGVAVVVKAHDVLAGLLRDPAHGPQDDDGAAPEPGTAPTGDPRPGKG